MRATEGQEPGRLDDSRPGAHIELHPGAVVAAAGGTSESSGTDEYAREGSGLEVVQGQFAVPHAPLIRRRRDTAWATTATAASISCSLVKRPKPNRKLLSLNASLRPSARST